MSRRGRGAPGRGRERSRLPAGFRSRVVASTGQAVAGTSHVWHAAPDGARRSRRRGRLDLRVERRGLGGGAGAIEFDAGGAIVDAYSILSGTRQLRGRADALGDLALLRGGEPVASSNAIRSRRARRARAARARHASSTRPQPSARNAARVPDRGPGPTACSIASRPRATRASPRACSRRRRSSTRTAGPDPPGQLRPLAWHAVPNPNPTGGQTADAPPGAVRDAFNGGEGAGTRRARHVLDQGRQPRLADRSRRQHDRDPVRPGHLRDPVLSNVDNVYTSPCGDVSSPRTPAISRSSRSRRAESRCRSSGSWAAGTEITGPALSPGRQPALLQLPAQPGQDVRGVGSLRRVVDPVTRWFVAAAVARGARRDRAARVWEVRRSRLGGSSAHEQREAERQTGGPSTARG